MLKHLHKKENITVVLQRICIALAVILLISAISLPLLGGEAESIETEPAIDIVATSAEFEHMLAQQNFPESYRVLLREVHRMHPNWRFEAHHTGLDWDFVIQNQLVPHRNLVNATSVNIGGSWITTRSSWKSTEPHAFNWATNTWVRAEPNWIQASEGILSYFLDPRNFLTSRAMFQFEMLGFAPEIHTLQAVEAIIAPTFMHNAIAEGSGGLTYAQVIMNAGQRHGVSPVHLASRIRQEHGSTRGAIISGTHPVYPGLFNYFNIGATSPSGSAEGIIGNALRRARQEGWTTPYLSIQGGAAFLAGSYIGRGQNTLYLQKFNVCIHSGGLFWRQYMTNVSAAYSEGNLSRNGHNGAGTIDSNFLFRIPVFQNMPEQAAPLPTVTGNPNFKLRNLSLDGHSISPTFHMSTADYTAVVPSDVDRVHITAETIASTSTVTGAGNRTVYPGLNYFQITVTAENSDVKVYTLTVYRTEEEENNNNSNNDSNNNSDTPPPNENDDNENNDTTSPPPTYNVSFGSGARINGNYIGGIARGTTVTAFRESSTLDGAVLIVHNRNGIPKSGDLVTGDRILIYNQDQSARLFTYTVVIAGDVSGRGTPDIIDLGFMRNHIHSTVRLSGAFARAGSFQSHNTSVTSADFAVMRNFIINGTPLP